MKWLDRVPWLERSTIAQKAWAIWDDFQEIQGKILAPPYPVEALIEKHLGLSLEYDDLEEILGESEVLGATWVNEGRVIIHEGLADGNEGRIAFTCAHEVGHWILHRKFLEMIDGNDQGASRVVCRKRDAKLRGEWQADYFASCLLMPEEAVSRAFRQCFGPEPLVIHNRKSCFSSTNLPGLRAIDPALENVKEIASWVIEAGKFSNVSKEAMRYRLEDLGLLINNTGADK